jgi:hypothetical protein
MNHVNQTYLFSSQTQSPARVPVTEPEFKHDVLEAHENKHHGDLEKMRREARHIIYTNMAYHRNPGGPLITIPSVVKYGAPYSVTSDDVRLILGIQTDDSGKCTNNRNGAIFKSKDFAWTGTWYKCQAPGSKARIIRVWTLSREKFIEKYGYIPINVKFAPQIEE